MYFRVDELEDSDAIECFQQFGSATDTMVDRGLMRSS
jgi:hypothetical protein